MCVQIYYSSIFDMLFFFSNHTNSSIYIYTHVYIIFHCHTIEHEQIFIVSLGYCYVYYNQETARSMKTVDLLYM